MNSGSPCWRVSMRQTSMPTAKTSSPRCSRRMRGSRRVGGPRERAARRRAENEPWWQGQNRLVAAPARARPRTRGACRPARTRASVPSLHAHEDARVVVGRVAEERRSRRPGSPRRPRCATRRRLGVGPAAASSDDRARGSDQQRRAERQELRELPARDVVVVVPADGEVQPPARRSRLRHLGSSSRLLQQRGHVVRRVRRRPPGGRAELDQVDPHLAGDLGAPPPSPWFAPPRRRTPTRSIATPRRVRSISSRVVNASACDGQTVAHIGRFPTLVRS